MRADVVGEQERTSSELCAIEGDEYPENREVKHSEGVIGVDPVRNTRILELELDLP